MKPLAKPTFTKRQTVRITFGDHAGREGEIVATYETKPGRPQPTAMIAIYGGGLVIVPVNDLEAVRS